MDSLDNPNDLTWMARKDCAKYLRISVDTVDRKLIPLADNPEPVEGRFRYTHILAGRVRIVADDVYRVLPRPRQDIAA